MRTPRYLYAEAFDAVGALDKLEGFAGFYGVDFYELPRNTSKITLVKSSSPVAAELPYAADSLVPSRAGESVGWSIA